MTDKGESGQGFLFDLGPPRGRVHRGNSSTLGLCELCGVEDEVWECGYCRLLYCSECGSKNKGLCERCLLFYSGK